MSDTFAKREVMFEIWMASDGELYEIDYNELFECREPDPEDPNEPYELLGDL